MRDGIEIVLLPRGQGPSRTISLSRRQLRGLIWAGTALLTLVVVLFVSWSLLAARALRAAALEAEVESLRARLVRVDSLVSRLAQIERHYSEIQELFGVPVATAGDEIWLPARDGGAPAREPPSPEEPPSLWPLAEPGYVTRTLLEGGEEHPGVDIAVAAGSYIRAAGGGVVAETGDDPVYGHFLLLRHSGGFETLYAHATRLLVAVGDTVRSGEVIATSGSTGRSSAPHLHFEIRLDGRSIDPLTVVDRP